MDVVPHRDAAIDEDNATIMVSVTTKVHLWWTWLRIAVRHVGQARRARRQEVVAASFEATESAALSQEFEASLVAIAAVAFAMEALDLELAGSGHALDETQFTVPKPTNRGFWISQRLAQAFRLDPTTASRFEEDLVNLFDLRNGSTHFESGPRAGMHPHPSGTNTALELTLYTLEQAEAAILLGEAVVAEGASSAADERLFNGAKDLQRELPSVLKMLHEVMTAESF